MLHLLSFVKLNVTERKYDVVVIGAGGAGLMCAAQAGKRGRKVAVLDHSTVLGRKILISGGGRCNFTNIHATADNYVSQNPHFCKSALSRYTPQHFIELVNKHRIAFHEKKLGQLFCDGSAQQIVDMLFAECKDAGAEIILGCTVKEIDKVGAFQISTTRGKIVADSLVIATGGLSIPKIGATGFGYQVARQFGLKVVPTAPALDGFNFSEDDSNRFAELTGVSVDTVVSCNEASFRENILFTHTGLSGPASLQASLYWNKGDAIEIDLLPGKNCYEFLSGQKKKGAKSELKNVLSELLPKRLAEKFCQFQNQSRPLNQLSEPELEKFAQVLHQWQIVPPSTVGYRKAEVTRGGVSTAELSSKTMESSKVPGLFFIGEVVDVTGQLGGFNFQWAWASAHAAAQFV